MLINAIRRFREDLLQNTSDALTYWIFPTLAAVLPAAAGQWVLRSGAQFSFLFRDKNVAALAAFQKAYPDLAATRLLKQWRLLQLTESSDWFRIRFFGFRLASSRIEVVGSELVEGGSLLLSPHWGCGFTLLSCLKAFGYSPRFVYRSITSEMISRRPLLSLYYNWRVSQIDRLCGNQSITMGNARAKVESVLTGENQKAIVVVLPDAPYPSTPGRPILEIGGIRIAMGRGALQLAGQYPSRVLLALSTPDLKSGRIRLSFERLDANSSESVSRQIVQWCENQIQKAPWCWHLWHAV